MLTGNRAININKYEYPISFDLQNPNLAHSPNQHSENNGDAEKSSKLPKDLHLNAAISNNY